MFSEYVLILVWVGLAGLVLSNTSLKRKTVLFNNEIEEFPWLLVFIVVLPLIIMTANRDMVGDSWSYRMTYVNGPDTLSGLGDYYNTLEKDKGFYMMTALLRVIFGSDYRIYFFFIALFQATVVASVYRKYSANCFLSILLFLISTDYFSWMFNGIRQFFAVCIVFACTYLMLKKKYIPLFILIIFASFFHQTALLMIPFVLVAQGKAWNKRTLLFILAALAAVMFLDAFTDFLDESLSNTQYKNVVSDYTSWEDDGTNPLRVAIYSIPAILSFFARKKIRQENNAVINLSVNMSIISMCIYIVSMVTSGIFIGRLPIYCSLYGYISLPWTIDHLFKRNKYLVYFAMIVLYFAFYYYQMHIQYGLF